MEFGNMVRGNDNDGYIASLPTSLDHFQIKEKKLKMSRKIRNLATPGKPE